MLIHSLPIAFNLNHTNLTLFSSINSLFNQLIHCLHSIYFQDTLHCIYQTTLILMLLLQIQSCNFHLLLDLFLIIVEHFLYILVNINLDHFLLSFSSSFIEFIFFIVTFFNLLVISLTSLFFKYFYLLFIKIFFRINNL